MPPLEWTAATVAAPGAGAASAVRSPTLAPVEWRIAVVDLGSNSFRLVVFTHTDTWWKRTDEIYEPVRVGAGQETGGPLQPEPMERALETIVLFAHFCRASGIERVRPLATSAIREAANREEFVAPRGSGPGSRSRCCRAPRRRTTATWPQSTRPR